MLALASRVRRLRAPLLALATCTALSACTVDTSVTDPNASGDKQPTSLSAKEQLGKLLFEDTRLSEPPGESCESCHDAQHAFAGDAGSKVEGVAAGAAPGATGSRNTPTALYAMYIPPFQLVPDDTGALTPTGGLFWDGRADTLAAQAEQPLLNPREMNNPSVAALIAKIREAEYAPQFMAIYGADALDDDNRAFADLADAMSAFESTATFRPFASKFDDYLRGTRDLTPKEARGFALFQDPEKGNCIACHAGDPASREPSDWLFTDFTYDTLGVPRNPAITDNADPAHFDLGLCQQPGIAARVPADFDLDSVCGAFRVPTLRDVAVTGPYMHDGRFTKLRDVVAFYVTRDTDPTRWYPDGTPDDLPAKYQANINHDEVPYDREPGEQPRLTDDEIDDVVAFLETLTDR